VADRGLSRREAVCLALGIAFTGHVATDVAPAVGAPRPGSRARTPAAPAPCRGRALVRGAIAHPGAICLDGATPLAEVAKRLGGAACRGWAGALAAKPGDRVDIRATGGTRAACLVTLRGLPGAARLALGTPIDLNRARGSDLMAIPGIGPALSEAIVRDRRVRGRFSSLGALERVRGVGPATVRRIAPFVVIRP